MSAEQVEFVTYCIGNLSQRLGLSQPEVYNMLAASGILNNYIVASYDVLHTLGKDYLMEDLSDFMRKKKLIA